MLIYTSLFFKILGQALQELSKDKPSMKQVESHTTNFIKTLEGVESGLTKQINYLTQVSTGQPHEGSCYAAQKDLLMAMHRVEHVKSRLNELEKIHNEHLRGSLASNASMASSQQGSSLRRGFQSQSQK